MTDTDKKFHPYDKDSFEKLANRIKKFVKEQQKRRNDKEILEALLSCEDPIKAVVMMQAERKRQAELIKDNNE